MRYIRRTTARAAFGVAFLGALALPKTSLSAQSAKLARHDLLVTSDWLATQINNPKLVLLHLGTREEYDAGHIPGARFVEMDQVSMPMTRDTTVLALEMPPVDELRRKLEALGISDDSRVVAYYGKDWLSPTTRVLLTLQYAGLGRQASMLDGGMPAWTKSHALTTDVPPVKIGKLTARPTEPVIADAEFVQAHVRKPGFTIVDARNTMFYDGPIQQPGGTNAMGRPRPPVVPAHVPGAVNIVFQSVFDGGYLLPEARLREMFSAAGVKPNDTIIAYCHIGQQATALLFAARALGHDVKLYDGSFQDWERRKLPVEHSRNDGK
jgi:thiosulfate/3-mercaptopyruvate sulfurtransferase